MASPQSVEVSKIDTVVDAMADVLLTFIKNLKPSATDDIKTGVMMFEQFCRGIKALQPEQVFIGPDPASIVPAAAPTLPTPGSKPLVSPGKPSASGV